MTYSVSPADTQINKKLLLTVSIVTFNPNFDDLQKTLSSLQTALNEFPKDAYAVTIVDNSNGDDVASFIINKYPELPIKLIHGHGNIGFGRAHNLALQHMGEFHLILNPDIQLDSNAVINALAFMQANSNCGLLSPYATWPSGQKQYLCKRYPAVFDLLLRGFAPKSIRSLFFKRLARYELRAETQTAVYWNPPIVSGCFMFFRSVVLEKAGAFSNEFFLYFEDFDLSLKSGKFAHLAYVPTVRIIHSGGYASKKGYWHIKAFIRSAITFYRIYGLRIL
jgi:GT2 family glycosyltransferase